MWKGPGVEESDQVGVTRRATRGLHLRCKREMTAATIESRPSDKERGEFFEGWWVRKRSGASLGSHIWIFERIAGDCRLFEFICLRHWTIGGDMNWPP